MSEPNTIKINEVEYVRRDSIPSPPVMTDDYFIVRSYGAGVFAGYIESRNGKEVVMHQARRLWYWSGASSLSQLAMEGVKNPNQCKFPCAVATVLLTDVIEILTCTQAARNSIAGVPIWKQ